MTPFLITILIMLALIAIATALALALKALPIAQSKAVVARLEAAYRWCWRNGQELVGLPVALLLFWWTRVWLRWLEPDSAPFDAGVLHGITVVVCHLLVANSVARFGARINSGWFSESCVAGAVTLRTALFTLYFIGYCILAAVI